MEKQGLKKVATQARKAVCTAVAFGLLSACGGGGGGGGDSPNPAQYSGVAGRASITTSNAVAFTTDAFEAASIGSSSNIVGVMASKVAGRSTTTLPELATELQATVAKGLAQRVAAAATFTGVATSDTIYGTVGGSASISFDVQSTGSFTGKMTLNNYQDMTGGPTISGTVTVTGLYNEATARFDSITMVCSPLAATTANGTANLYGSFAFSSEGTSELLKISCTLNVSGKTYWIKDWTYTFTPENYMTITGVYYHPSYGYVEVATPTRLTVSSLSGYPTAGVFQAAGAHCSKAKLTFSATGSIVTAIGGDNQDWEVCGN